ncbi:MAG: S8 family serine peptidase [Candidatus Binatia bacterium]
MIIQRISSWSSFFFLLSFLSGIGPAVFPLYAQQIVGPLSQPTSGPPEIIPNQIVVRFRAGVPQQAIDNLHAALGTRSLKVHRLSGLHRLSLPAGANVEKILAAYRNNPLVEEAGPNFVVRAFFVPNDTNYSYQWHMKNTTGGIWAEKAWDLSTTKGQGVTVAVIDTGVAFENFAPFVRAPDLQHKTFVAPWNFLDNNAHPNDDNGHGSHVTGTIAQDTGYSPPYGVAGVAYNSSIMPLKVLGYDGSGADDDLVEAIYYAANHGADVINMSLGFSDGVPCSDIVGLPAALDYAHDVKKVVIVAAAGNEASTTVSCPASYDKVIAVAATRYDGLIAPYSNRGKVDIVAPGGDPNVDQNGDGYSDGVLQETFCYDSFTLWLYYNWLGISFYDQFCDVWYSGTSMASPHVAGAAALLLGEDPSLEPPDVRDYLTSTARDRGAVGKDTVYGWGVLDVGAALAALNGGAPPSGECTVNADCNDGLYCNGIETCVSGTCQAGTPVNCNDVFACTVDSCNETTDACDHIPNNALCNDGAYCNGAEICNATAGCQSGTPVSCSTGSSCNEATDQCTQAVTCSNLNRRACNAESTCRWRKGTCIAR